MFNVGDGPRPVVAAAIVDSVDDPKFLLCTPRAYPQNLRGLYEFPGGKVEPGEDPLAALHREIAEELSLPISVGVEVLPQGSDAASFGGWPILQGRSMRVWLAQPIGDSVAQLSGSHLHATWVPLGEVDALNWLPTNEPILRAFLHAHS